MVFSICSKSQTYVTESGAEAIFEPIKFKFTKPLVYEPINNDTIQNKVIYFQVNTNYLRSVSIFA